MSMNGLSIQRRKNITPFPGRHNARGGWMGMSDANVIQFPGIHHPMRIPAGMTDTVWSNIPTIYPGTVNNPSINGGWVQGPDGNWIWHDGNTGAQVPLSGNTPNQWAIFATTLAQQVGGFLNQRQALDNAKFAWQMQGGQLPSGVAGAGASGPNTGFTGLVNQVTTFASNNPLLVAAGVAGVFLLMMNPPSKRR